VDSRKRARCLADRLVSGHYALAESDHVVPSKKLTNNPTHKESTTMKTVTPLPVERASENASGAIIPASGQNALASSPMIVMPKRQHIKIQPEVHIGFAIDRTGSSGPFAQGIKQSVALILKPIQEKARLVRVWQQTHGDEDYDEHPILITDGGTVEQALADNARIVFEGGGDAPEHQLSGIHALVKIMGRVSDPRKSRGAIIACMTDDTKPDREGMMSRSLGEKIKEFGLLFYAICEPYPFAEELTEAAGGLMFPITNEPDPAQMQRISAQLSASILATVAAGATRPMTVPMKG